MATNSHWSCYKQGQVFSDTLDGLYEAVIGAEVARKMGYGLGQSITLGPRHARP